MPTVHRTCKLQSTTQRAVRQGLILFQNRIMYTTHTHTYKHTSR